MTINNNSVEQINVALLDMDKKLKSTASKSASASDFKNLEASVDNIKKTLNETAAGLESGKTYNINISGNAATADKAKEAEKAGKLVNALTVNGETYDGSEAVDAGVQKIENGGTGATTAKEAEYNIVVPTQNATLDAEPIDDEARWTGTYVSPSKTTGRLYTKKFSAVWNYIKDKISSILGLTKDNYGGKASTAGTADKLKSTKIPEKTNGVVTDLNNYKTPGFYHAIDNTSYTNAPIQNFTLQVIQLMSYYTFQVIYAYNSSLIYTRSLIYGGSGSYVWTKWICTANATTAVSVVDYGDTSKTIKIGYTGAGATVDNLSHIAGYLSGGTQIKDVSKSVLQSWIGLSNYLPLSGGTVTGATQFNNYVKLNAWPGYGTGTANLWYDGNNKFVEIQNATDLKLSGVSVSKEGHKHSADDITSGTLPVANGGTGVTTQEDINKAFINNLEISNSDVTDGTEFVSSYASDKGFADPSGLNKPYKRQFIKVWNYIKGKISSVLGLTENTIATLRTNADQGYLCKLYILTSATSDSTTQANNVILLGKIPDPASTAAPATPSVSWDIDVDFYFVRPTGHKAAWCNVKAGYGYSNAWRKYGFIETFGVDSNRNYENPFYLVTLKYNNEYYIGVRHKCDIDGSYSARVKNVNTNGNRNPSTADGSSLVNMLKVIPYQKTNSGNILNNEIKTSIADFPNTYAPAVERNGDLVLKSGYVRIGDSGVAGSKLTIQGRTVNSNSYTDTNPKLEFKNNDGIQNISLTFTDFDAVQAPASLTLNGNQGNEYFIAPNIKATTNFIGNLKGNVTGKSAKSSFLDEYPGAGSTRLTSLNIVPKDATEYGGMRKDVVTDSVTDDSHPGQDGHLLTMFWDNSGRYDGQFFVSNSKPLTLKARFKPNTADYGPWIDVITSNNIGSQTVNKVANKLTINGQSFDGSSPLDINIYGAYDHIVYDDASLLEWANCTDGSMKKVLVKSGTYNMTKGVNLTNAGTGYVFAENGTVINSKVPVAFTASSGKTVIHNLKVVCGPSPDNTCAFSASDILNLILYDCEAGYAANTITVNRNLFSKCTCYNCHYNFTYSSSNSSMSIKVFYQCYCYNCICKQTIAANSSSAVSFNDTSYFYKECVCISCDAELTTLRNIKAATPSFSCYYNCWDRCVGCLSKINVNSSALTVYSTLYGFLRCQHMSSCKEVHTEGYTNIKGIVQCIYISSTSAVSGESNTNVGNSCNI